MSTRFEVTEVEPEESSSHNGAGAARDSLGAGPSNPPQMSYLTVSETVDKNQLTITSNISGNLALYEDDIEKRPKISVLLNSLKPVDGTAPNPNSKKKKKKANLGTIVGVYLPTIQNILGVILFLRLPWIVGIAGVGMAFFIVFLCCTATMLTAISLSAIATNGRVPGGGVYFMLSRNLGPEFGGAVGILFYLATTFASSLYIVGAIEILVTYIVPQASLFGDLDNNVRVYGTILLLLLTIIVFVGVKIVNWFATFCLAAVLIAVVSIYAGAFNPVERVYICELDGVALTANTSIGQFDCQNESIVFVEELATNFSRSGVDPDCSVNNLTVNPNSVCSLHNPALKRAFNGSNDDSYYKFRSDFVFTNETSSCAAVDPGVGNWTNPAVLPRCVFGIPGITRTFTIVENTPIAFLEEGESTPGMRGVPPQLTAAMRTDFLILIGIFFPSVTGIMAGSNRSGDLKDAQKSIPIGTILAILTTSLIYLSCVLFFGGTIQRLMLRDQFGTASSGLTVALLAWPTEWIILIGALLSTIGAALQSLTGAPRLLQAIANDNLISFLSFFKRTGLNGEPSFALILTALLSEIGVLIASLDLVAPILTMFFLICYMFVNFACTLQSILKSPSWRPRFRFYHWSTSLIGAVMCFVLMFMVMWYYAIVALFLAFIIYKYIEYRGAEKEWGDGVTGLSLQAALYSLLRLEEGPLHTKNWRPQILLLCKLDQNLIPSSPKVLSFASQLKAGKGLMMISSVVSGKYTDVVAETIAATQSLKTFTKNNKIDGFCNVVAATDVKEGLSHLIQSAGLGGMKHNTVVICWPESWRKKTTWGVFTDAVRVASAKELAILVPKGINWFPSNQDHMKGSIDIWWVVHDGGLLMLLPFLLLQHKVWRHCKLRIFTVAQMEDNSIQMKKDLAAFLYQLRISATVDVIEMPDNDISAYTYERTLIMEQRNEMLKQMRLTNRQKRGDVQHLLARSFSRKAISTPASPAKEFSLPVPKVYRSPTPPPLKEEEAETVSIGELSIEPRVVGPNTSGVDAISSTEFKTPPQDTSSPQRGRVSVDNSNAEIQMLSPVSQSSLRESSPPPCELKLEEGVKRRDSLSSDSDSCPEEQSVRTPLLEQTEPPLVTTLPTNPAPSIKRYDEMFAPKTMQEEIPLGGSAENLINKPQEDNVRRMNTSVKLNELIVTKSHDASLVIINLPAPPRAHGEEENYMEFLDVLTEGLERVLMVRGGGREVITIYS